MSLDDPVATYRAWSRRSGELHEQSLECFPGGDTRASAHFAPYPLFIEYAEGCRLHDADGHELLDFMNNFTSLVHGHAFPPIVAAVQEQVALGSAYAAPSRSQLALAQLVKERVPSIDLLRFCSSGSEATLMALRCARAVTGRQRFMKMEGGYHGSYETAEVSLAPLPGRSGDLDAPRSQPIDASIPQSALDDVVVCPFNEPERARRLIARHGDEIAAVIVEPILGSMGMLPATTEFLQSLREATEGCGALLIFDEVISLRLAPGGAQALHGVTPDLTALGKIIGGGLPVGAIGGRHDLMSHFDPREKRPIFHASTFSGNAVTMAAGHAAMEALSPAEHARLDALGERLRAGFTTAFAEAGIHGRATGQGSLANIHFTTEPLHDARDTMKGLLEAGPIPAWLHLTMLRRGIASASRLMYCTSTAMGNPEVDQAIEALAASLHELRPALERKRPGLLVA